MAWTKDLIVRRVIMCAVAAYAAVSVESPGVASETITYTYDARGRLVEVRRAQPSGNVKTEYAYDKADNRTKKEVTTVP